MPIHLPGNRVINPFEYFWEARGRDPAHLDELDYDLLGRPKDDLSLLQAKVLRRRKIFGCRGCTHGHGHEEKKGAVKTGRRPILSA